MTLCKYSSQGDGALKERLECKLNMLVQCCLVDMLPVVVIATGETIESSLGHIHCIAFVQSHAAEPGKGCRCIPVVNNPVS